MHFKGFRKGTFLSVGFVEYKVKMGTVIKTRITVAQLCSEPIVYSVSYFMHYINNAPQWRIYTRALVSRGQTSIFSAGRYRLQYKRPH